MTKETENHNGKPNGNGDAEPEVKDFYNVINMTKAFREFDKTSGTPNEVQKWQVRCMLGILQQLTMVAGRLHALVSAQTDSNVVSGKLADALNVTAVSQSEILQQLVSDYDMDPGDTIASLILEVRKDEAEED